MESLLATLAEHGGPEWVLIIWLLWRGERAAARAEARAEREAELKLRMAQALRSLSAKVGRGHHEATD